MTFPLFRLPSVALREALTHLQLDDLFVLSLCSQKTNRLIKSHYKKGSNSKMWLTSAGDLPMVVSSLGSLEITILVTERRIWANSENVEIGGQKMVLIQVINYDTHEEGRVPFEVLCAEQRQGFKAVVDHIRDLIVPELDSVDVNPPFLWMLEAVEDPFKSGNIRSRRTLYQAEVPFSEEEVQYALDTCNSNDIRFKPLLSAGFCFTGNFKKRFRYSIYNAHWVTIDNLISLAGSSVEIGVYNSKLTSVHLNLFMKHWLNHKINGFRLLTLNNGMRYENVFAGMEVVTVEDPMFLRRDNLAFQFPSGSPILRREDGLFATVTRVNRESNILDVAVWTEMVNVEDKEVKYQEVWPIDNQE